MGWAGRLLIALTLVAVGAAATVWVLARYDRAAQFVGVAEVRQPLPAAKPAARLGAPAPLAVEPQPLGGKDATTLAELEDRLAQVEKLTQRAAGSAGRADALVVAFAARRAIDRGAPLGFLESLLVDRFGAQNARAVATIISASRTPVRIDQLTEQYEELGPQLRGSGPEESWWSSLSREFGSLVEIRRADAPSTKAETRYRRAAERLSSGDVDGALAETMRLPGSQAAADWAAKARRYIAAHRALDELESAALMSGLSSR
jgi:hypothetical protein